MNKLSFAAALALACSPLVSAHADTPLTPPATPPKAAAARPAAPAKAAAKAPAKKVSPAEAALIEQFVALQDAAISNFLSLGTTLKGVKDKQSADQAAPTVRAAGEKLADIIARVEALGTPSEAAQQAIMSRMANLAERKRIEEEVMLPLVLLREMEPPCYGSETLYTEITNLIINLQGAAGIEEGEDDPAPLQEPDADEAADSPAA